MTTTSTLPVLLGLLDGPIASRLFTPLSALFGCWFSFAAIVVYGKIMLPSWGGSLSDVSSCPHLGPSEYPVQRGCKGLEMAMQLWNGPSCTLNCAAAEHLH